MASEFGMLSPRPGGVIVLRYGVDELGWCRLFLMVPDLILGEKWSIPKNTKTYYIVLTYATVHMLCCVLKLI